MGHVFLLAPGRRVNAPLNTREILTGCTSAHPVRRVMPDSPQLGIHSPYVSRYKNRYDTPSVCRRRSLGRTVSTQADGYVDRTTNGGDTASWRRRTCPDLTWPSAGRRAARIGPARPGSSSGRTELFSRHIHSGEFARLSQRYPSRLAGVQSRPASRPSDSGSYRPNAGFLARGLLDAAHRGDAASKRSGFLPHTKSDTHCRRLGFQYRLGCGSVDSHLFEHGGGIRWGEGFSTLPLHDPGPDCTTRVARPGLRMEFREPDSQPWPRFARWRSRSGRSRMDAVS